MTCVVLGILRNLLNVRWISSLYPLESGLVQITIPTLAVGEVVVAEGSQAAVGVIKEKTEVLGRDINQMVAEAIQTKDVAERVATEVVGLEVVG
jgi:hypothetical protein